MADSKNIVMVVYNPPTTDFPYLSVAFVPGSDEPVVATFATAAEAEHYNKVAALELARNMRDA